MLFQLRLKISILIFSSKVYIPFALQITYPFKSFRFGNKTFTYRERKKPKLPKLQQNITEGSINITQASVNPPYTKELVCPVSGKTIFCFWECCTNHQAFSIERKASYFKNSQPEHAASSHNRISPSFSTILLCNQDWVLKLNDWVWHLCQIAGAIKSNNFILPGKYRIKTSRQPSNASQTAHMDFQVKFLSCIKSHLMTAVGIMAQTSARGSDGHQSGSPWVEGEKEEVCSKRISVEQIQTFEKNTGLCIQIDDGYYRRYSWDKMCTLLLILNIL